MNPLETMREAGLEIAVASLATRTALRPLARESAARQARAAEDRFIAARLEVWGKILPASQGPKANSDLNNNGGN